MQVLEVCIITQSSPRPQKAKAKLNRGLGHGLELDLVTACGESRFLHALAEEVQVGEELAGVGIDGAP
jgi:hypothetical protein